MVLAVVAAAEEVGRNDEEGGNTQTRFPSFVLFFNYLIVLFQL
jgi:hypothetical protein